MGNLKNWDFSNIELNSNLQLINRQKSALNLEIINLDIRSKSGTFCNKKNGEVVSTYIDKCECNDFQKRQNPIPCMHIYRLAIELNLMEIRYVDRKLRDSWNSKLDFLQKMPKNPVYWGGWNPIIHTISSQEARQGRAYGENELFEKIIDFENKKGIINGYKTSLESCTCPDFEERRLPCKHIYFLALSLNITLPLSKEEYFKRQEQFIDSF